MSRTTTTYEYPQEIAQAQPAPKPERLAPVGYHIKQAALAAGSIAFVLFFIAWLIYPPNWLWYARIAGIIGLILFGILAPLWINKVAIYDWKVDEAERKRRQKLEDEARKAAGQENVMPPSAPIHGERIDRLARIILERHYLDGLDATREACESANLCTQPEWNAVNQVMKMLDIKGAKDFKAASYEDALTLWRANTRVEPDVILVWKNNNQWDRVHL